MKKTILTLVAVLALTTGAAGGCQSKGTCHPGDTRGSKGHTDICNDQGKWTPMRTPIKPVPLTPSRTPNGYCATSDLGKKFTQRGVTFTCKAPKPYRWRA